MSIYLVTTYGIKKNPKQEKTSINTRDRWGEVASGRQELQIKTSCTDAPGKNAFS
jgi:hypothetical protein